MLVKRAKAGESLAALSAEYSMSESGLRDLVVVDSMVLRKPPMTPEDVDETVRLYESGYTVKQVVKRVGYSFGTVRRVLHEQGVTMRSGGIQGRSESGVE